MGSNSGSQPQNIVQTNTTQPYEGAKPLINSVLAQAPGVAANGFNVWGGPAYIPPTAQEKAGLYGMETLAKGGHSQLSGLLGNQDVLRRIASGADSITVPGVGRDNADFRGLVDRTTQKGVEGVNALFSGAGRYGGGAHQAGVQETAGDIAGGMYAGQYNQDVDARMRAQAANLANRSGAAQMFAQLAPGVEEARYAPFRQLVDIGAAWRGEIQDENAANQARWEAQQMAPINRLLFQSGIAGGMGGMGSTSSQSVPQGSRISGLLGGAAMGAGVGSSIMPGWGTAIGGGLGALGGLFA